MKEIIINNQQISVKEYNGQRVTTFRDIDRIHERPEGTARRNFNSNKEHLTEGTDYFRVSANEIRTQNILEIGKKQTQDIVFLTESGYLMLVKSMNDPLAWKIQRMLVDNYFHAGREPDSGLPFTWRGTPVITTKEIAARTGLHINTVRQKLKTAAEIRRGPDYFMLEGPDVRLFHEENEIYGTAGTAVILVTASGMQKLKRHIRIARQNKMAIQHGMQPALPPASAPETRLQSAIADIRRKVCALDTMLEFIQETHGIPHTGQNEAERLRTVSDFGMMLSAELVILKRYGKEEK